MSYKQNLLIRDDTCGVVAPVSVLQHVQGLQTNQWFSTFTHTNHVVFSWQEHPSPSWKVCGILLQLFTTKRDRGLGLKLCQKGVVQLAIGILAAPIEIL